MSLSHTMYETMSPPNIIHITSNISITEKQMKLTRDLLKKENVCYIVAILPSENDFLKLNDSIKDFPYTVIEYDDKHEATINKEIFNDCGSFINKSDKSSNILVLCNNGYQRSIPFIVQYLIKFHPIEYPTIEKALSLIFPLIDKSNYLDILELTVDNVRILLE